MTSSFFNGQKMMTKKILVLAILMGMVAVGSPAQAQTGGCLPGGDQADGFRNHIGRMLVKSASDTNYRHILNGMGITDTLSSSVTLVTNDSICIAVAQAQATTDSVAYDGKKVHVVKIGTSAYVLYQPVQDPNEGSGPVGLFVCDLAYVHKGDLSY